MNDSLNSCRSILNEAFASVSQAVGIHVSLLVFERALWITKHTYEEASLISFSEEGISLGGLDELAPERALLVSQEFVQAVIATLGRLVGKQLACQLTAHLLDAEEVAE